MNSVSGACRQALGAAPARGGNCAGDLRRIVAKE